MQSTDAVNAVVAMSEELKRFRDHNSLLTRDIEGLKKNVELLRGKCDGRGELLRELVETLKPENGDFVNILPALVAERKAHETSLGVAVRERDEAFARLSELKVERDDMSRRLGDAERAEARSGKIVDELLVRCALLEDVARQLDGALTEWEKVRAAGAPLVAPWEVTQRARKALHGALTAAGSNKATPDALVEARRERDQVIAHTHTLGRQIEALEHDLADQTQTLSILLTNGDPTLSFNDCFQRVDQQTSLVVLSERVNELEAERAELIRVQELGVEAVTSADVMRPFVFYGRDARGERCDGGCIPARARAQFENARDTFAAAIKARPPAGAESTAGPTEALPKAARRDPSPPVDQSVKVTDFMPADVAAQVRDGTCATDVGQFITNAIAEVARALPTSEADERVVDARLRDATKDLKVRPFRDPWTGPDDVDDLKRRVAKLENHQANIYELTDAFHARISKLEDNALLDREFERKRAEPPRPAGVVTMAELEGGTGGGTEATTVNGWNESRQRFETPPALPSAKGERCTMCRADAVLKVEQSDPPQTDSLAGYPVYAHPYTAYVCETCFRWIMFGERLSLLPVGSRVIARDGYGESAGRVLSVGTLDAGWQYTPGAGCSHYEVAFDLREGHGYIPREQVRLETSYATTRAKPGERLVPREQP
jgi:hypothetical protein